MMRSSGTLQSPKRVRRTFALFLAGFVLSAAVQTVRAENDESEQKNESEAKREQPRPVNSNREYQNLWYSENWGPGPAGGGASRSGIKDLPLNGSGSFYASLGGQIRLRGETWSSFGFREGADDTYGLSRLRLHADIYFGPRLRFFAGPFLEESGSGAPINFSYAQVISTF